MQKFMVMMGLMLALGAAYADDTANDTAPAVVERADCTAIAAQIKELSADDPDGDELAELRAIQRAQCMPRVVGRRGSARGAATMAVETETDVADDTPAPDTPDAPAPRGDGPCADGGYPNKYGCCSGDRFTNMGGLNFACCPKSGDGECYAPMEKNKK
ncbi:hypothetical protein HDR63_03760 [bacterium]|nr:hypothetical protein [bacterium]